jgi:hypothetical protein
MLEERLRQKLNQEADAAPAVESVDHSVVRRARRGIAVTLALGALTCLALVGGLVWLSTSDVSREGDRPVQPAEHPESDPRAGDSHYQFSNIEVERPDPKFFGSRTLHVSFDYAWQGEGSTPSNEMCTVESEDRDGNVLISQQGAFLVEEGVTSGRAHFRVSVPPGINPLEIVSASLRCSGLAENQVNVPDIVGVDIVEAIARLEEEGFKVDVSALHKSERGYAAGNQTHPRVQVTEMDPPPGTEVSEGTTIAILDAECPPRKSRDIC